MDTVPFAGRLRQQLLGVTCSPAASGDAHDSRRVLPVVSSQKGMTTVPGSARGEVFAVPRGARHDAGTREDRRVSPAANGYFKFQIDSTDFVIASFIV